MMRQENDHQMQKIHIGACRRFSRLAGLLLLAPVILVAGQNMEMLLSPWLTINDNFMGGVSSGRMAQTEDGLRFEGSLSLENNGGFASVRRPVDGGLAGISAIRIKVRGDSRQYQLRMRHGRRFDGVSWRAGFVAGEDWQTFEFGLDEFEPVFRGSKVPDAGNLVPANIGQLGFLLADGRAGSFALDIATVEFIGATP
jgi:monofunctional biosynthetic peptidoglycan transglycosylase